MNARIRAFYKKRKDKPKLLRTLDTRPNPLPRPNPGPKSEFLLSEKSNKIAWIFDFMF